MWYGGFVFCGMRYLVALLVPVIIIILILHLKVCCEVFAHKQIIRSSSFFISFQIIHFSFRGEKESYEYIYVNNWKIMFFFSPSKFIYIFSFLLIYLRFMNSYKINWKIIYSLIPMKTYFHFSSFFLILIHVHNRSFSII